MKTLFLANVVLALLPCGQAAMAAEGPLPADEREAATSRRGDAYYHLMKARLSAGRGRVSEAIREVREAAEIEPDSPDLQAEGAGLLALLGRREDSEAMARRALQLEPQHPLATRTLADLLAARALGPAADAAVRQEAIRLYEQLAEVPEADGDVLQILTNLRLLGDDLAGATQAAQKFATRHPGDVGAAKLLAKLQQRQGKAEEALRGVLGFLSKSPDEEELLSMAADLANRTGQWEDVEKAARSIVEARPEQIGARTLWGEALLRLGRVEEAAAVLEKALGTAPPRKTWSQTIRGLVGEAYLRLGKYADAVVQLEKALELGRDDPLIRLHLASAYGYVGRLADASALAKALAGDYPGNPGVLVVLGECLAQQGLVDSAVEAFTTALGALDSADERTIRRRDDLRLRAAGVYLTRGKSADASRVLSELEQPDHPEALRLRAKVAVQSGRLREAQQLTRRLREDGGQGVAGLLEGEILLREGREGKAAAKFDEALAALGPATRDTVATLYRDAGHTGRAEEVLREWIRLEPQNPEARFGLARFLERVGRFGEAEVALREVLNLDPRHGQALNYLAYSLADRNEKLEEALELIRRALAIDQWNGAFLDSLGWVYYRLGLYEDARDPLERAAREYPRDPTVLEHLGDLYERLGDLEGAERAWKRALDADPEDPDVLRGKITGNKDAAGKSGRDRSSLPDPR